MHFGTIGAGRIGLAVLRRLKPFDLHLHYGDPHRLCPEIEKELDLTFHPDAESLVRAVDIIDVYMPLYPSTEHFFNDTIFAKMKRGAYVINTARGKLVERDTVVGALKSGHIAGYAVDVWFPQPAPADHPWRTPFNGMTSHISRTCYPRRHATPPARWRFWRVTLTKKPIREEYLIVDGGMLAVAGARSDKLT